jgi:hypothetical protein
MDDDNTGLTKLRCADKTIAYELNNIFYMI